MRYENVVNISAVTEELDRIRSGIIEKEVIEIIAFSEIDNCKIILNGINSKNKSVPESIFFNNQGNLTDNI